MTINTSKQSVDPKSKKVLWDTFCVKSLKAAKRSNRDKLCESTICRPHLSWKLVRNKILSTLSKPFCSFSLAEACINRKLYIMVPRVTDLKVVENIIVKI